MTADAISLFYDQPPTTQAERAALDTWTGREPGEGLTAAERRTTDAPAPPTPAPDLEPGDLAAWTDEGGCSHVGRVESVEEDAATLTYGPRPHRARVELDELRAVADKDGRGNLR